MKMDIAATMVLYAAVFFGAGWGWGQWWAERQVRQERRALEAGRVTMSMPAKAEDAAAAMEMMADMVRKAEEQRKAKAAAGY